MEIGSTTDRDISIDFKYKPAIRIASFLLPLLSLLPFHSDGLIETKLGGKVEFAKKKSEVHPLINIVTMKVPRWK